MKFSARMGFKAFKWFFLMVGGLWASPVLGQTGCAPTTAGLVSWWRGGSNALDFVGVKKGTFSGANFVNGEVGLAFSFDATGNNLRVPASLSLEIGGASCRERV